MTQPTTHTTTRAASLSKAGHALLRTVRAMAICLLALTTTLAFAAPFTPGNLTVLRADSNTLNNTTATLVEVSATTAGQTAGAVQAITIDGATLPNAIRISGSATSTGYLSRSQDGTLLSFGGHNGTTTTPTNANTITARAVGTFSANGVFALGATYTGTSGNQVRGATSLNNTTWFVAEQGGIYTNGATAASPTGNLRNAKAFGGSVYVGQASSTVTNIQVSTVSAATGGTITGLPGFANNASLADFHLISSGDNGSAFDVLYVLSSTTATAGSIAKYSLVSGSWVANGSYTTAFGGFGITAADNGNGALLYVTTGLGATAANNVLKIADTAGYNAAISITTANNVTLYTAPAGTTVKGVAFAPVSAVAQPDLAVSVSAPATALVNTNFNYTITASNTGAANATGVAANFTIPAGLTFVSASGTDGFSGTETAGVVNFTGGTINASASATLTVTVSSATTGNKTAPVGAAVIDPALAISETNEGNNSSTVAATTAVLSVPAITTQPTATQTIASGATTTLTVAASGFLAPTFQWYEGASGDTATPVVGAVTASFTTPALTVMKSYWARATNASGTADSNTAVVNISAADLNLSALVLSGITLDPVFGSATTSYTASVPNATVSTTVTPTTSDSNATVTVNGNAVLSGEASGAISLNPGANVISVVVTGADMVATKTYTVTVTRLSNNADLSVLGITPGSLVPAFDAGAISYTAAAANATTSITVTPTVAHVAATVTVNGTPVVSGQASGAVNLNIGANNVSVVVTAQDLTTKTYSVVVTRAGSPNANLSALTLSTGAFSPPVFTAAATSSVQVVPNATTSVAVTPTVAEPNATITVNGTAVLSGATSNPIALLDGINTISTVVTAQDGTTTKNYVTKVIRQSTAVLAPGSIAFTGFNADGDDNLAFAALTDIPANTVIFFSDDEWNGTDWADANESAFAWVAGSNIPAGTIVALDGLNNIHSSTLAATSNLGTIIGIPDALNNPGVSASDEIIFAFQSTGALTTNGNQVPTAFLAAIANEDAAGGVYSLTGTGLSEAAGTAIIFLDDDDGMRYKGVRNGKLNFADYLTDIADRAANWETVLGGDGTTYVPFSPAPFTAGPTVIITINDVSVSEGNSGTTNLTFTVTRANNTGAFTVDYATADGTGLNPATLANNDYVTGTGTVAFTVGGALTAPVTVVVNGDSTVELNERLFVNLSNVVSTVGNAVISDAQGIGTILTDDPVAPSITTQPASQSIATGTSATLSVAVEGFPAPTFQWYEGATGVTTAPVSGATSATFTTPALLVNTDFWVRVTNTEGFVDSNTATITVALGTPLGSGNVNVLIRNNGTWNAAGVNVGGTQFVNLGLQGMGRVPSSAIDSATGESLGSISDMQITGWKKNVDGSYSGTLNTLPDRGFNATSPTTIFSNYAARINSFAMTFTPYTAATPTAAQNQVALTFTGSTRFTYDHDGNSGTAPVFTTGLLANGGVSLFGNTVPVRTGASTQSDGTVTDRLTLDSEGLVLDSRTGKAGAGWIGDEYGAHVYHFNSAKQIDGVLQLPAALVPHATTGGPISFIDVPANVDGRRINQGLEGIAQSPDGTKLFALMQSGTMQDAGTGNQGRFNTRLAVYDISSNDAPTDPIAQYVIQLPRIDETGLTTNGTSVNRTGAQSSIIALNDTQLLILSRDGNGRGVSGSASPVFKSVLLADLSAATNIDGTYDAAGAQVAPLGVLNPAITPISWTEALNMIGKLGANPTSEIEKFGMNLQGGNGDINTMCEKWEALGMVSANDAANPNDYFLFIGNDNDFLTATGKYLETDGTIHTYDAGLENDTIVLAYRVRLTGAFNQAPFVSNSIPNQSLTTFQAPYSYTFAANTFTDPESQTLTYTATLADGSALPAWLTFDGNTRTLTASGPEAGVLEVKVTATDSGTPSLFVSTNFSLSVTQPVTTVASGDVTQTSAVLWAHPYATGAVTFDYTTDASFATGVSSTSAAATNVAVPVKVQISGLSPATTYYYRATSSSAGTASGRFRTSSSSSTFGGLHFGVSGDQRGELAPYPSVGNVAAKNLDFFIHLGDSIYGDVASRDLPTPQARSISDYRTRHNEVYSSRYGFDFLSGLRASTSVLVTTDDHEVTNDYSGAGLRTSDARFSGDTGTFVNNTETFQNGIQAFREYNPIENVNYGATGDPTTANHAKFYRFNVHGKDAATFVLDARSFRSQSLPPVTNPNDQTQVGTFLAGSFTAGRTLLGAAQLAQLKADLLTAQNSGIVWKFINSPEPMQNFGPLAGEDRWEGYGYERTELLKFIGDNHITNVVFVAADFHGTAVNRISYQLPALNPALQAFQPQIQTDTFEIITGAVAYDKPFGPTIVDLGVAFGLVTAPQQAFYNSLPNGPTKEGFVAAVINGGLSALGYNQLNPGADPLPNMHLTSGLYMATNSYGWTEFTIDQSTQNLTVRTYGIEPYNQTQLDADPAAVAARTPVVVSEFVVAPKPSFNTAATAGLTYRSTDGAVNLATATGVSPLGGTFSGPGVSGGQFNPSAANVGVNVITYSYVDGFGTTHSATFSITVNYTLQVLHYYGESGLLGIQTAPIMGAMIDKMDNEYANTVVLGEGDSFIPGPWLIGGADPALNAVPSIGATALGRPDIAIMNAFGTTASALGNHEFDLGSPVLAGALFPAAPWVGAQFPLITANLDFANDSSLRARADSSLGGTGAGSIGVAGSEVTAIKAKIAPYAIKTLNGQKIGFVGATTWELLSKSSPNGTVPKDDANAGTSDLQEVAAYLQGAVNALNGLGVNKIILIDQLDTLQRNKDLAGLVSGIDIMVAGGGHERMGDATDTAAGFNGHDADFIADAYPIVTAGLDTKPVLIVTTDTEYTYLGRLVADFDANGELILPSLNPATNGAYVATEAKLQAVYGTTDTAAQIVASSAIGTQVKAITDAINNIIIAKDSNVFGYTNVYLEGDRVFGRTQEVNLGDITADANLLKAKAALGLGSTSSVFSLKNGGGLRASLGSVLGDGSKVAPLANTITGKPAGGISQLDVENALRFDNKLMVCDMTPAGLLSVLNFAAGLSSGPTVQSGGYSQVGNIRYSYDSARPAGQKVRTVALINDADQIVSLVVQNGVVLPTAPALIQAVALNFTMNGGDNYPIKYTNVPTNTTVNNGCSNFRFLLTNGTLSAPVARNLDFTATTTFTSLGLTAADILGEQAAFQDYLVARHSTPATAYNIADTAVAHDIRIQQLAQNGNLDTVNTGALYTSNVAIGSASVVEGNSGTVTVTLPVTHTVNANGNTAEFSVNYAVTGGTATAGTDFATLAAGTLTFPAGGSAQSITLTINGDTAVESAETIIVSLSNVVNTVGTTTIIGTGAGTATITNDDTIPVVYPGTNDYTSTVKGSIALAGAEIPAFDPLSKRAFASSNVGIQVVDLTNPAVPTLITTITPATLGVPGLTSNDVTSVTVRKGAGANPSVLAAAILSVPKTAPGYVIFLNAADGTLLGSTQVGANPDNLTFTPDGTKVLVANEGELDGGLLGNADVALDTALGTVSIIDVSGGFTTPPVATADFTAYDSQVAALRAAGVRIFKNSAGVDAVPSLDFEPEYIAVSPDGTTAMVTLQEANALGVLDIATATFTSVIPLGKKDFSPLRLDFSDRDGPGAAALINPTVGNPVFGLYMPDAIASYSVAGQTYYVAANEGDDRNDFLNPDETILLGAATGYDLDPTVFPNAAALKNVASLGRLTVSNSLGLRGDTDGDGDIDEILAYGGRSFSIYNAAGVRVFDSGDMIDLIVMSQNFSNFDDTRSDNKGSEPEGVTIATLGARTYAFIGLERSHMVLMFDITNPTAPTYTTAFKRAGDLNPEGLVVVQAADSPNGKPLLITASEISNTLSIFEINDNTVPTISPVSIASNNVNPARAKMGDAVTLSFSANEPIATPTVTLFGSSVTATNVSGNDWAATVIVGAGTPEGAATFTISANDLAGNPALAVSATTDASTVIVDKTTPVIAPVALTSTNTNPIWAKVGDTVTLTFTASETVLPVVTLLGETVTATSAGNDWTATVVVGAATPEGLATFSIAASDLTGNAAALVSATTNASAVTVDRTAPTLTLPANITRGATSVAGAIVTYTASASGATTSSFTPVSGSIFPIGVTTVNATASDAAGNTTTGSFTVTVNPGVSIAAASTSEGNSGTKILNLPVSRADTSTAFTVNYAATGGTATAGTDFTLTAGTLTFNVGDGTQQIAITVNGDTAVESAETVIVTLSGLVNVTGTTTIATASASGTIANDDTIPVVYPSTGTFTSTVKSSINLAGAEIPTFDPLSKRAFASSNVGIQVVDLTDPAAPTLITTITPATLGVPGLTSNDVTSVTVRKGSGANPSVLAAAIIASPKTDPGYVVFLNAADGTLLGAVQVGSNPDNLTFTPDGTKVLVANEAELDGGVLGNADVAADTTLGTVSIIDISGGFSTPVVMTADFTAYDTQVAALKAAGVRIFNNGTIDAIPSRDFEPEYIAVAPDGLTAMVTLQEANAVAILDIATATFTSIKPLGKKDFSPLRVDFSDRDGPGGVALINPTVGNPVFGLYMPDAIASYSVAGQTYYVMANEGDDRNDFMNPDESTTVGAANYVLDPTVFPNAAALKNLASLGRLTVSNSPGLRGDIDNDGDVDEILAYGGRSFSIVDAAGNRVFDSGDMIDLIVMSQHFSNFDDTRSDNKGSEPEGVTIATLGSQTYAFIGLERAHMVMMFDITNPLAPTYTTSFKRTGDLNPEGLIVVSAADSPNGKPLLITASEVSNTLSVFEINDPTGPVLTLPANIVAEATSAAGATITYSASAADAASGVATSSFTPASGSVFPIGVTTVNASATDNAGNTTNGSFTVTVQDTTAPTISGTFSPLSINAGTALADYRSQAVTSDAVGVTSVLQAPPAGTIPGPGIVNVTITATDDAGHSASTSFNVTVVQVDPTTTAIASKGGAVPNAGTDSRIQAGAVWTSFGVPSVNDAGAVAFLGSWRAPAITGTSPKPVQMGTGIFVNGKLIAKKGDAVVGVTNGVASALRDPLLGPDGSVAWIVTLTNAGGLSGGVTAANNSAIMLDPDGDGPLAASIVVRKGAVATGAVAAASIPPGVDPLPKWIGFTSVALGEHSLSFTASLARTTAGLVGAPGPGGVTMATDSGLWVFDRGTSTIALATREGDALLGSTVRTISALATRTGSAGQGRGISFDGTVENTAVRVILADARMAVGSVAQNGTSTFDYVANADAVGYGAGAKWASFGLPTQNTASALAFLGTVKPLTGTATAANNIAIFAEDDTYTAAAVVKKGDASVGIVGGKFASMKDPVSAGNRSVAFIGTVTASGVTGVNNDGIWHSDATNGISLIAREGAQPPEAPVGAKWKAFTSLALPASGRPMFVGSMQQATGGITAANDIGLWATDSSGSLRLLLQEGDVIGTSTIRNFAVLANVGGSPAQTRSFNSTGSVIVRAVDTTGAQHILQIAMP